MNNRKIMVVEDDALAVMALEMQLRRWGYDLCESVSSGEEAIRSAIQEKPDIILMDIKLKGPRDGVEIALEIIGFSQSTIIFITSYPKSQISARCGPKLPFKYLSKPVDMDELKHLIESS